MKIMVTIFLLATPLDLCRAQPTLANVPISEHIEHTSSAYFQPEEQFKMNICGEKWIFFLRWGGSALLPSVGISTSVPALVWTLQSWWSAWTWRDFKDVDKQASIYQKKLLQVQRYHGARQKWRQVTKRELIPRSEQLQQLVWQLLLENIFWVCWLIAGWWSNLVWDIASCWPLSRSKILVRKILVVCIVSTTLHEGK